MSTMPPDPGDDEAFESLVSGLDMNWGQETAPAVDDDERPEDHYDFVPTFGNRGNTTFVATGSGTFRVDLPDRIRELLHSAVEDLRGVLLAGDAEQLRRLYPAAYPDHEDLDATYQELMADQLLSTRLENLDLVDAAVDKDELTSAELHGMMQATNEVRLVLGTKLDITDDADDPDPADYEELQPEVAVAIVHYQVLGSLLERMVDALFSEFPDE